MSMTINQNYDQFFKGMEAVKNYGSSEKGKKDKLVRYQFNTTDDKGNKIMDKMSREETLQAMKEIRSQYGDDVIIEFSGDGMAALVESKNSGNGPDLDSIMGTEQRAVPDDMVTQLEGTYRVVSENDEVNTHVGWHDTLKQKAPDVCDELDDLMQQILDHGLNHRDDSEKFGKKFIEIVTKAEQAIAAYDEKAESGDETVDSSKGSGTQSGGIRTAFDIMRKHSPETADKIGEFVSDFWNTRDKSYLMQASRLALDWLNENYPKHPEWFGGGKSSKTDTDTEASGSLPNGRKSFVEIMQERTPDAAKQMQELVNRFWNTGDKNFLGKASRLALDWLNEYYSKHPEWFNTK